MATTTVFPSLQVPAPEDTMEMSSPIRLPHDDDIDLDFDGDYDGGVQLEEDMQMLTDGEQTRPPTATDASMDDDMQPAQPIVQEAQMQDEPLQEDDELIDYDDDYLNQPHPEDTIVEDMGDQQPTEQDVEQVEEQIDEEIDRQPEGTAQLEMPSSYIQAQPQPAESVDVPQYPAEEGAAHNDTLAVDVSLPEPQHTEAESGAQLTHTEESVAESAVVSVEQPSVNAAKTLQAPLAVETGVITAADAPDTPTDTGLHPVTLYYEDLEMPLFKSKHQQDGLLKNDNLASLSLAELMTNCRIRLATKLGRDVPEAQDFVLSFDHLGLILVENSRCAFQSSLNDVLEVYLALHQNDGEHDIPPLSLTLTQQFKFSSNLAMLKQRAERGEGVPQYQVPETNEGDDQQYYHEDHEDHTEPEESGDAAEDREHAEEETDAGQAVAEDGDTEEAQHQHEDGYSGDLQGPPADATQYAGDEGQHYDEQAHIEHVHAEVGTEVNQSEMAQQDGVAGESALHNDTRGGQGGDDAQAVEQSHESTDGVPPIQRQQGQALNADSTPSSQTVQGDFATDIAGEYDEDAIDWDDDSDLTNKSSELGPEGHDEFSTFLTDYEAEEAQAAQDEQQDLAGGEEDESAKPENGDEGEQSDNIAASGNEAEVQAPGFEGRLDAHAHQAVDETVFTYDASEQDHDGADAWDEAQQEDQYYQADIHDEQQEGVSQPRAETEQLHSADDLLAGDEYAHGPEHETNRDSYTGEDEAAVYTEDLYKKEDEEHLDPEDDLVFDDETTEQHEARKASHADVTAVGSGSPLGKRSFQERAETEDLYDDEPDLKKVRSQ